MTTREQLFQYVYDRYGAVPDFPWKRTPDYAVLRHSGNRKWFAAIVDITEDKIGLRGKKVIDAMLLKCNPLLIGCLLGEKGIFPAYHMNKEHWLTLHLGEILPERAFELVDISFELTK